MCHNPPPPPQNSTWLFQLRKFSCQTLGRWWWGVWYAITPTTTPKLNLNFFFFFFFFLVDLGISSNFLQLWFRCIFWPPLVPLPPSINQTVKKNVLVDLGILSNFLQLWFRCKQWSFFNFFFFSGSRHFRKFPATLVQVHILTPQTVNFFFFFFFFLVDLGISANFLQLWFRYIFWPPLVPLPPLSTQQWKKCSSGFRHFIKLPATLVQVHIFTHPPQLAKQWNFIFVFLFVFFFFGFRHFIKFPATLVEVHILTPTPPHRPNSKKKFF